MPARHRIAPLALLLPATLAGCGSLEYSVDESHLAATDAPSEQATAWLPEPTGSRSIGTSARWIDTADRSLPIQLWYPTDHTTGERTPYMSDPVAEAIAAQFGIDPAVLVRPTHSLAGAPPATEPGGRPAVVISPGLGLHRSFLTALAEDLASHGYAVAAVDHPGDTIVSQTRTGELIPGGAEPGDELLATRVRDVDTAISYLTGSSGDDVLDSIDRDRIAVLGHSYGGATAAQVAATNPAVSAVGVLDASIFGSVAADGLDVPTLLLTAGDLDPTQERFWDLLTGPRTGWQLRQAGHFTFTDLATLVPALGSPNLLSTFDIGTDPNSSGTAVRELVRSFLDQHLGTDTDVLDQIRPIG